MKFEHRSQPLLTTVQFIMRLARSAGVAVVVIATALMIGILGYHYLAKLAWIDALVDASMILSGMGPVNELHTSAGKIFAACYALFSGVVFLGVAAILLGPAIHRLLHRFHLEADEARDRQQQNAP